MDKQLLGRIAKRASELCDLPIRKLQELSFSRYDEEGTCIADIIEEMEGKRPKRNAFVEMILYAEFCNQCVEQET